jgi:hypothetical protein
MAFVKPGCGASAREMEVCHFNKVLTLAVLVLSSSQFTAKTSSAPVGEEAMFPAFNTAFRVAKEPARAAV